MTTVISRKIVISLLSLLMAAAVLLGVYYYQSLTKNKVDLNRLNEIATTTSLNEEVQVSNLKLVVDKIDRGEIKSSLEPPDNYSWFNLYITLENTSEKESSSALSEYFAVDSHGNKYQSTHTNLTNRNSPRFDPLASLTPEAQMRGWIGFIVPSNAKDLMLVYTTSSKDLKTFTLKP